MRDINPNPLSARLVDQSLEAGLRARELLWQLSTLQIGKECFLAELGSIPAKETVFAYWSDIQADQTTAPCLEILQIIYSLREEIDYQMSCYGLDSFKEDIKQLDRAIKRLEGSIHGRRT